MAQVDRHRETLIARRNALLRKLEANNQELQRALQKLDANRNGRQCASLLSPLPESPHEIAPATTDIFAWSPDGRRILINQPSQHDKLVLHDLKTKNTAVLPASIDDEPVRFAKFLTNERIALATCKTLTIFELEDAVLKIPLIGNLVDCTDDLIVVECIETAGGMKVLGIPLLNKIVSRSPQVQISGGTDILIVHEDAAVFIFRLGLKRKIFQGPLDFSIINALLVDEHDLFLLTMANGNRRIVLYHSESDNVLIQIGELSLDHEIIKWCLSGSVLFALHARAVSVVCLKELKVLFTIALSFDIEPLEASIVAPSKNPACFAVRSKDKRYFFRLK